MRCAMRPVIIVGFLVFLSLIVVGLMIPAVGKVREAANRTRCNNNLRQIGIAMHNYSLTYKDAFPSATMPNAKLTPEDRLSWLVSMLPYIESDTTYRDINKDQAWNSPDNRRFTQMQYLAFKCPSYPRPSSSGPALTHYLGITGLGKDAANLSIDAPNAGVFGHDRHATVAHLKENPNPPLAVLETSMATGPWLAGPHTIQSVDPASRPYFGAGRPFGGNHPGGANCLFLDASVKFFDNSVSFEVVERLAVLKQ